MKKLSLLSSTCGAAAITSVLLLTAGCGTPTQRDLMVEAVNTGERPVAMRGDGALFDGKLTAYATVSRGFERGGKPGVRGPGAGKGGAEDELTGGRRRRDSDGITEVYSTGFGDSEEEQKEAMKEYVRMAMARRAQGSPMPPVTLRVQIENRGTEPVEIEVTDVNSELGNFAVRPSKLTIAPGEKGMLDPMVSQLGVTSDEIPVKIAVRLAGKKDTQVIAVKNIIMASVLKQ